MAATGRPIHYVLIERQTLRYALNAKSSALRTY